MKVSVEGISKKCPDQSLQDEYFELIQKFILCENQHQSNIFPISSRHFFTHMQCLKKGLYGHTKPDPMTTLDKKQRLTHLLTSACFKPKLKSTFPDDIWYELWYLSYHCVWWPLYLLWLSRYQSKIVSHVSLCFQLQLTFWLKDTLLNLFLNMRRPTQL